MRDSNSRKCLSSCQGGSWKTASIRLMFAILETTWHDVILLDHLWHNLYSVQISQKISHLCRGKKQKPQTHALLICYRTLGRQALFYSVERKRRKKRKIELRIKTCKHWLFPNSLFLLWYAKMFWNVRFYFKLCSTKRKNGEKYFSRPLLYGVQLIQVLFSLMIFDNRSAVVHTFS